MTKTRSNMFAVFSGLGVVTTALVLSVVLPPLVVKADVGLRYAPLGYQQITSMGTAQSLTVPAGATSAIITAEAQAVRYRDDGTAPTATVGMPVAVAVQLQYTGALANIQFIEQTSGAKLNILYYR